LPIAAAHAASSAIAAIAAIAAGKPQPAAAEPQPAAASACSGAHQCRVWRIQYNKFNHVPCVPLCWASASC